MRHKGLYLLSILVFWECILWAQSTAQLNATTHSYTVALTQTYYTYSDKSPLESSTTDVLGKSIKWIFENIITGKVKVYDMEDEFFAKPLTKVEIDKRINRIDTFQSPSPYKIGETSYLVDTVNYTYKDIVAIEFVEEWRLTNKGKFKRNLIGYALKVSSFDSLRNFRGFEPLFLIKN